MSWNNVHIQSDCIYCVHIIPTKSDIHKNLWAADTYFLNCFFCQRHTWGPFPELSVKNHCEIRDWNLGHEFNHTDKKLRRDYKE